MKAARIVVLTVAIGAGVVAALLAGRSEKPPEVKPDVVKADTVDVLVARAQEQGTLRADVVPADFPVLQLMVGTVTDHLGQPELWRRYLTIIVDGLRAQPGQASSLPGLPVSDDALQQAIVDSSVQSARDRAGGTG